MRAIKPLQPSLNLEDAKERDLRILLARCHDRTAELREARAGQESETSEPGPGHTFEIPESEDPSLPFVFEIEEEE